MQIKFKNEEGCKYFTFGPYEFFANRQGKDGYTLEVHEWYHVPDKYLLNKHFSKRVNIPYEAPSNINRIKQRITQFLTIK